MMISLAQDSRGEHVPGWLVDAPIRVVRDQNLFRGGQPKTHIYLIEAGTIAVYETRIDGAHNVVEFAFAGDTVGFGFLGRRRPMDRVKYILWSLLLFLLTGVGIGWAMYPFSR